MRMLPPWLFEGRNGMDQLNKTVALAGVFCWAAALFVPMHSLRVLLRYLFLLAAGVVIYRSLSRNLGKRYEENQRFLMRTGKMQNARETWQTHAEQKKQYKVFKCPSCGIKLRVPRGKGKIRVTCRQCGASFDEKS